MKKSNWNLCVIGAALPLISACASVNERIAEPQLRPIEDPTEIVGRMPVRAPVPVVVYEPSAPNSLWQTNAKGFFDDQRASDIGDILTVNISITDNAQVQNTTTTSRTGSEDASVSALFGLQGAAERALPGANSLNPALGLSSSSSSNGSGSVNRAETINLTVAAVITDTLANGNFVIAGRQEVKVNAEVRELIVSGIIRPQDISSTNTISHTQMAEARISYGGRGDLSNVQRARYGQRVVDAVSPF